MIIFISGGCKNGKSMFAQKVAVSLSNKQNLFYIATMIPYDEEDNKRIERHIKEREGWGFETVECGLDIIKVKDMVPQNSTLLLDSVTALLLNEMFKGDFSKAGTLDSGYKVSKELAELCKYVENIVLVSDYMYSDAALYDDFTENYRKSLSVCDKALASVADTVVEICAGGMIYHKGGELI